MGGGQIPCGGVLFWVIALLPIPFFLLVSWITGNEVTRTYEEKVHLGYRFSEGDLQWTAINVRLYPLMGLFVGVVAGALGLGGGILLAPFILELGVLPLVTVSTTSFFVMFTTSSTSIQYIFLGQLTLDYAAFFSLMGGIGAAVGNIVLNNIATQTKRSWFLVAIMSFLLVVSMVLMTWMSWEDYKRFGIGFRDICEIKS